MNLNSVNYLTAAQVATLTSAQLESATILNSLNQHNVADSPPYIIMSEEEIQKIDLFASNNFTPYVISKMRSFIFSQLTTFQLYCLSDEQTSGISADRIKELSVDKFRAMAHPCSLNTEAVTALTGAQVQAISIDFKWMSVDWMAALSSSALASLTNLQLSQLNVDVLKEVSYSNTVLGGKFRSVLPSDVSGNLYLNYVVKIDPKNILSYFNDFDKVCKNLGVLNDETLCAVINIRNGSEPDGYMFIAMMFEEQTATGDFTSGIVEALNRSPNFVKELWRSSYFKPLSIIQSILTRHPGVSSGLNGMVWAILAQQSPNNFLALGSSLTSDALVKMCEYSSSALSLFSGTQISQLLSPNPDFFTRLEESAYLTKQQKLNIELLCNGVASDSALSKYFNGGPLAYLLNDNLNYTNQFDLGNVSVTLDARNFASWYSDSILQESKSQPSSIREMYEDTARITWLNGNAPAREALIRDINTMFGSLGLINSGIIDLGAPPVGASDTDVEAYCIKVLGKIGQLSSAMKTMQEYFDNVASDFGDLRFSTIDSYGLELDESAAAYLLNGSPLMGKAGGLTYRESRNLTFADASYQAITQTLTQIKKSFESCSNGIDGVMRNKKAEEMRNYYRDIFAGITGALTLVSGLASGCSAILLSQKNGWSPALYSSMIGGTSTTLNSLFSLVNNYETIHGWGYNGDAINFYHFANTQIAQAIDPENEIFKGLSKDKLDQIVALQRDTASAATLLVNKALTHISDNAPTRSDVTTYRDIRRDVGSKTLESSPSLFNIDLMYDAGKGKTSRLQHQLTAKELGVGANHQFRSGDVYNVLLSELNNEDTGCFARELQIKFDTREEIVGYQPVVGGYVPIYKYYTDMNSGVVNYYI